MLVREPAEDALGQRPLLSDVGEVQASMLGQEKGECVHGVLRDTGKIAHARRPAVSGKRDGLTASVRGCLPYVPYAFIGRNAMLSMMKVIYDTRTDTLSLTFEEGAEVAESDEGKHASKRVTEARKIEFRMAE